VSYKIPAASSCSARVCLAFWRDFYYLPNLLGLKVPFTAFTQKFSFCVALPRHSFVMHQYQFISSIRVSQCSSVRIGTVQEDIDHCTFCCCWPRVEYYFPGPVPCRPRSTIHGTAARFQRSLSIHTSPAARHRAPALPATYFLLPRLLRLLLSEERDRGDLRDWRDRTLQPFCDLRLATCGLRPATSDWQLRLQRCGTRRECATAGSLFILRVLFSAVLWFFLCLIKAFAFTSSRRRFNSVPLLSVPTNPVRAKSSSSRSLGTCHGSRLPFYTRAAPVQ